MDSIKEIAIANISRLLADDLDHHPDQAKWERVFKCAGQRSYYEKYQSRLLPFLYNGQWENPNNRYNPFNVLDEVFIELYSMGSIEELTKLIAEIVLTITKWDMSNNNDKIEQLNHNLNLLGYELETNVDQCVLNSFSSGSIERIQDVSNLSKWLEKLFPNTSRAYNAAISNYAQGNSGACVGECRVVLTGFYSYFKETKDWFNGVLIVNKETSSTEYKSVNKIFKDSAEGEYTRFKAVYRIYSMLSDLGTHRDEGTVETTTMSDALMCLRMTEDILINGMMNNLENEICETGGRLNG